MKKQFGSVKTTAIGGLIFLLPLIVIGALIGQVVPIVMTVAEMLGEWIPVKSAGGIALLIILSIVVILFLCFLAGLSARRSIGKKFSETIEKNLIILFPRYAILKDQMAGTIGGDDIKPKMKPVIVKYNDMSRIAFEIERSESEQVTIYLPGSPDPWSGSVAYFSVDRVIPVPLEFPDAVGICEQLGRNSSTLLKDQLAEI